MQLRTIHALAMGALASVSLPSLASSPASQDVTIPAEDGKVVTVAWSGTSPPGTAGANNTCNHTSPSDPTQDHHVINLTAPTGIYKDFNVTAHFQIDIPSDANADLVLTLEKDGTKLQDSDHGSIGEGEAVDRANPSSGAYDAVICSFAAPLPQAYSGTLTITVTAKPPSASNPNADTDGDGVPDRYDLCVDTAAGTAVDTDGCQVQDSSLGLPPRFQVHPSPPALGNDAGEPSIGFNPLTKRTMFISYTIALRETYPELDPARKDAAGVGPLPQSCDAEWVDKPGTLTTLNSLDPILFTDQVTGRTFNSQLSGDNSLMEYTDDDGETWTPAQAGPPNGGADHQTVATGPYSAGLPVPQASWPATGDKRAVYYCSQSVAAAFCSRSDDGGRTFGNGNTFKDTDCAAGALHGHVKVSPVDGTVYVPDSTQCILSTGATADHVVAFRSDDNGTTFTAKPIPQSTSGDGSDPSVGIATDGTLYMCYVNADSTVHMAVSKDRGETWTGGQDLGAPKNIVQTRFPQAIAGDGDRAACAFLGTSVPGNGESLDFQGAWYGFIATTYDGGAHYLTVNVTPRDPVQGYGGICGSGTCRNLLDFNDLQLDEQGRTLFAFADGCINGCVKDPSANAYASKATVVRQTGGRTLFKAFDDVATGTGAMPNPRYNTTITQKPTAACASDTRSKRSPLMSNVEWNAPDTGGSPITKYTVWRSTDPATGFAVVGTTTGATKFSDTSTSPSVEKYYYKVEAENANGKAPIGNTIELKVSTDAVDTCTIPGETIILDALEDNTGGASAPDMDIVSLAVAEPKAYEDSFVVTEKVSSFSAGAPAPGSFYAVLFGTDDGGAYFALDTTNGPSAFVYGTRSDPSGEGILQFTNDGALDARSSYDADGTITFVVPRSFFGDLAPGRVIAGWDLRARAGAASATSRDTAGPSDYMIRGTDICPDPGVALAQLLASVTEGDAPLPVTFTLTGTPAQGKKLDSYTLDFGETGVAKATGTFDATGVAQSPPHVYSTPGVYRALLTVTDTGGHTSTPVEQTITVTGTAVVPGEAAPGNNVLGGALPPAGVLVLGLMALLRRRR